MLQDYSDLNMVEDVIRGFEKTLEGICSSEDSTDHEDLSRTETCDKETNTLPRMQNVRRKSHGSTSGTEARNNAIRRSQTFSPACRPGDNYICKVRDFRLLLGLLSYQHMSEFWLRQDGFHDFQNPRNGNKPCLYLETNH